MRQLVRRTLVAPSTQNAMQKPTLAAFTFAAKNFNIV